MDEVRKKSLKEVLPKKGLELAGRKTATSRRHKIDTAEEYTPASDIPKKISRPQRQPSRPISYLTWACVLVGLIVGGYYLSSLFASVTVKITPRHLPVAVAGTFEANRAPAEGIEFSVIKLEDSIDREIPATGQAKIETKASGIVTITNNYSTAAQKLVAGTRLETNGLIYRLDSSITVPGQTKNGTTVSPGAISTKVTASEAGEKYNIGASTFKIVGFKGTPRYDKFTVKAKTNIAGGKVGLVSTVNAADKSKAIAQMQGELKDKVVTKAKLQIPKDFLFFDDGVITTFSDEVKTGATSTATLSAKVTMIAILFNTKNISRHFAAEQLKDEPIDGIKISNLPTLKFKLLDKEKFDFEKTNKISFTLDGNADLVWPINATDLKAKLAKTAVRDKDKIFAQYPAVHRAEATVRPPWVLSFPGNHDKINIKIVQE